MLALRSIYASDYKNLSVVVVDNKSTDGSANAVAKAYPETPLIRNTVNSGVSKGRNTGWQYAKENFDFEYVIFLDDDTEVSSDYFSRMVEAYQDHPEAGIVAGKSYISMQEKNFCSVGISVNLYTGIIYDIGAGDTDVGQYDAPRYLDACGGFAFSSRKSLFDKLDAFDERYSPYGWEDVDYCLRAKKAGFKVWYEPKAIVVHKGTKTGRAPIAHYEQNKIKNYLFLLKQHCNLVQKVTCSVGIAVKSLYIIFQMIKNGHSKVIYSQFLGFFQGLKK